MIRMMCEVRLIDRVLTDALQDRVGVIVQIENIIQSCLHWYGYVMHGDINSQIWGYEASNNWEKEKRIDQENCAKKA